MKNNILLRIVFVGITIMLSGYVSIVGMKYYSGEMHRVFFGDTLAKAGVAMWLLSGWLGVDVQMKRRSHTYVAVFSLLVMGAVLFVYGAWVCFVFE